MTILTLDPDYREYNGGGIIFKNRNLCDQTLLGHASVRHATKYASKGNEGVAIRFHPLGESGLRDEILCLGGNHAKYYYFVIIKKDIQGAHRAP